MIRTLRQTLTEIRDLCIVNRHYNQILVDRSALMLTELEGLRVAAERAEKAMTGLVEAVQAHPDSADLTDAKAVAAEVAAGLNKAAEAAEAVVAALVPAPAEPAPAA